MKVLLIFRKKISIFFMKRNLFLALIFSLATISYSLPSKKELSAIKVLPESEVFFTQTENCYSLRIPGVEPGQVQLELAELPLGTKFVSSTKEEYLFSNKERGTQISLWFTFSYPGNTRIAPLLVRINGRNYYFEFEQSYVYENPALISPALEIEFENSLAFNEKKDGKKIYKIKKGEKIIFTVKIRYATQILDFNWKIPEGSIFTELERYDFAKKNQKISQFTSEAQNLSKFQWQILKEGLYDVPQIYVEAVAYNGTKKQILPEKNVQIEVINESYENTARNQSEDSYLFRDSFEIPQTEEKTNKKNNRISTEELKKLAESKHLSFFDKLFSRKYAIFAGGTILSVPEAKASGQIFSGGQKVLISENAGEWAFIECKDFSGWTKKENIFEIK